MDLSIIIPIYNVETYLDKCIESLVKLNLKDTEIILVDDGSTDSSGRIADQWASKCDYIAVYHTENSGQAMARNLGIKKCSGKYVTFIDSDDYVEDNFVEIYKYLNKDADIIFTGYIAEYLNRTDTIAYKQELYLSNNGEVIDKCLEISGNKNSVCCKMVKRDFIINNDIWFIAGYAEDYNWAARAIIDANSAIVLPISYYHYIAERPNSTMNTYKIKRLYDIVDMSRSILNAAQKANLSPKRMKKIKQFVGFNVLSNFRIINKLKPDEQLEAEDLLKKNIDLIRYQKSLLMKAFKLGGKIIGYRKMYKLTKI